MSIPPHARPELPKLSPTGLQLRMNNAIDVVLDVLDQAASDGIEIDPLATILDRVRARGADIDLSSAPPLLQMILGPMLAE